MTWWMKKVALTWLAKWTGYPGKGTELFPGDSKVFSVPLQKNDSHTYRARSTWGTLINEVRGDKIGRGTELTVGRGRLWDVLGPRRITVHGLDRIRILAKF